MKTAVQLRDPSDADGPQVDLVYGEHAQRTASPRGPVALFGSEELVAIRIRSRRRTRLFVFRTLVVDDELAASVPGVRPRVRLLFQVRSAGRARLVARLFAYLVKLGQDPAGLPDDFYLRVGAALGGRLPPHRILLSLLRPFLRDGAGSPERFRFQRPAPDFPLALEKGDPS